MIDLSVIYGVYKTREGLFGFFQRCTKYDPAQVNEAVTYIMENVQPKPYDQANARRMMKQIEGHVPKEYQWKANGCLAASVVITMLYLMYLVWMQLGMSGVGNAISQMDGYLSGMGRALSGTMNAMNLLLDIHFGIVLLALICNAIGYVGRKPTFSFIAAGIYVLALFTFVSNWIFIGVIIALTCIGGKQVREEE